MNGAAFPHLLEMFFAIHNTKMLIGRLMKKTHLQLTKVTTVPATTGPNIEPTAAGIV